MLILEISSSWDIKKGQFQYLVTVLAVFLWSVNCTILICKFYLLFQNILNLRPVLILEIFSDWDITKGQFQFLVTFLAVFFSPVNYTILVCKLYLLFQTILNLQPKLIFEIFSGWDSKKGHFQFLVTFLAVFFLVCKLYKSGMYILIFWTRAIFYLRVFSI